MHPAYFDCDDMEVQNAPCNGERPLETFALDQVIRGQVFPGTRDRPVTNPFVPYLFYICL